MPQAQTEMRHGVDATRHDEFLRRVAESPEKAVLAFRATGTTEEAANRTTATIGPWSMGGEEQGREREHVLHFGLPPQAEEAMGMIAPKDRIEAVEGALAALTACVNGTIVLNAMREGVPVERVTTEVRIPLDVRVLFGARGLDALDEVFGDLSLDVAVQGRDLTEDDLARIREYPARSPVYNLFTRAHPAAPRVTKA